MGTSRILVRATCHLGGLPLGHFALVDPDDPEVAALLDAQLLVPERYADEDD